MVPGDITAFCDDTGALIPAVVVKVNELDGTLDLHVLPVTHASVSRKSSPVRGTCFDPAEEAPPHPLTMEAELTPADPAHAPKHKAKKEK